MPEETNIAYVTVVLVTLLTFKFQQIVRSWYSVQVTFVCTALLTIHLRSNLPNLFKICRDLRKLWRNTFWCVFYAPQCRLTVSDSYHNSYWFYDKICWFLVAGVQWFTQWQWNIWATTWINGVCSGHSSSVGAMWISVADLAILPLSSIWSENTWY